MPSIRPLPRLECAAIGLSWIEIVNDDPDHFYISEALPLLITDNADICEEVCQLTNSCHLMTRAEAVGVLKASRSKARVH